MKPKPDDNGEVIQSKHNTKAGGLMPYIIVNSSYLIFTVTDGAVRMIVLLHAFNLGFTAMEIATM